MAVTAEPDEQRLLVKEADPAGEGMEARGWTFTQASSACCTASGTGTSRSRPPSGQSAAMTVACPDGMALPFAAILSARS